MKQLRLIMKQLRLIIYDYETATSYYEAATSYYEAATSYYETATSAGLLFVFCNNIIIHNMLMFLHCLFMAIITNIYFIDTDYGVRQYLC